MAKNNNLSDFLSDIANAIREKKGSSEPINAQDFSSEIASISTGGGDTPIPDMPVIGDGKTYLYIKIAEEGRMTVPLYFSQSTANKVIVDWGDGSETQTFGGTGNINTTHTYAEIGEYVISLNPIGTCTLGLGNDNYSSCVMGMTGNAVYCNMLQAVEVGNNVRMIDKCAFLNCHSLASVVILNSISSIGEGAFQNCYALTNIVIPNGITRIDNRAFSACYSLTSIVIPSSVTRIAYEAFKYCSSLTNIIIPKGITELESCVFQSCYSLESIVIPSGVTSISTYACQDCFSLASIVIPDGVKDIGGYAFASCHSLANIVIPSSVKEIGNHAFSNCKGIAYYDFTRKTSIPTIGNSTFSGIPDDCKIIVPLTLYDEWVKATNWSALASHIISDYTPTECVNLEITGKDVRGRATSTKVSYTAITNGVNSKGERMTNITITGDAKSNEFPQNISTTDTIERTISYTYLGVTATTTITQGVWVDACYTVDLNDGQWAISDTVANPDAETYDGVYQSVLSKGVSNSSDTMYVDIDGYNAFKLYVRSYAEGGYDYVMVSQLDKEITGSTSDTDSTLVKASTKSKPNSDTSINGYTLVEFTGIDEGAHRITIVYRKDSGGNSNDDRGYVLIPKKQ